MYHIKSNYWEINQIIPIWIEFDKFLQVRMFPNDASWKNNLPERVCYDIIVQPPPKFLFRRFEYRILLHRTTCTISKKKAFFISVLWWNVLYKHLKISYFFPSFFEKSFLEKIEILDNCWIQKIARDKHFYYYIILIESNPILN